MAIEFRYLDKFMLKRLIKQIFHKLFCFFLFVLAKECSLVSIYTRDSLFERA